MKTPRLLKAAGVLVAASSVLLTACGAQSADSGTDANGVTEIVFASYSLSGTGAVADGTKKLIDQFMAANPDVKVTGRAIPNADILTKTRTDVASGDSPDIVQMGYSKVMEALTTLPVISIEKTAGDEWADAVKDIPQGPLNTGIYQGSNYAVPFTLSTPTMFYNATLFEQVGLDPNNPPQTLDQVRAASQKLKDAGDQGVYFGNVSDDKSDFLIQSVLNSTGGGFVDANDKNKVIINSPESQKAFQLMQDLTRDGLQPAVSLQEALAPFTSGKLGMFITTTAYSKALAKAAKDGGWQLRSTGFPQLVADRPAAPTHSGAALMMLKTSDAKAKAAWKFVKYMTTHEAQMTIVKDMGYLPLLSDMVDDPKYLADYFKNDPLLLPATKQLANIAPYQFFPGKTSNQSTRMFIDECVEPVILRGADVAQTTNATATKLQAAAG